MLREPGTIITAPPTELPMATPGRPAGHRVLWFATGLGLFTIDATLLLALTWMLLHL